MQDKYEIIDIQLNHNESIAVIGDLHFDNNNVSSRIDNLMYTTCDKLDYILKKCIENNVKIVLFQGDVLNRVQVSHEAINLLGKYLLKFKNKGMRLFTIIGNHDMYRNNIDYMVKTPLQTLFTFNILEHINLNTRIVINKNILLTPVDYIQYPPCANKNYAINILLAHMFFNKTEFIADKNHNLSINDVKKLNYDFIFLGHDHEEYKPIKVKNSYIYRQGSVLRGTSHNYNFKRNPCFLILSDLINFNANKIKRISIKVQPYKDVISSYIENKKNIQQYNKYTNLLYLATKLTINHNNNYDNILKEIKTTDKINPESKNLLLNLINEYN